MKTALVTGAGRGIGLATARAFLNAGWKVLALDKDFSNFDLKGVERLQFDLRNLAEIGGLVEKEEIHTLVNNAGVLFCDPYGAIPEEHKREVLTVNLEAPARLIECTSIQMKKRGKDPASGIAGRIVNVGSVAAFTGHPDLWYGITKAGILNLTKAWARELGPHGVLVNAVAPGPTQTAMYDQLPQSRKDGVMKSVYTGRVCTPEEVASAILWLGTACPEYVNGTTLDVNNGSYPR
jgi:NAD(P)-dependent dehydrogenase (short-subunit alcohol dehydrogenase family)